MVISRPTMKNSNRRPSWSAAGIGRIAEQLEPRATHVAVDLDPNQALPHHPVDDQEKQDRDRRHAGDDHALVVDDGGRPEGPEDDAKATADHQDRQRRRDQVERLAEDADQEQRGADNQAGPEYRLAPPRLLVRHRRQRLRRRTGRRRSRGKCISRRFVDSGHGVAPRDRRFIAGSGSAGGRPVVCSFSRRAPPQSRAPQPRSSWNPTG